MTSKERVRAAIEHRQPDRVPIDYHGRGEVTGALCQRLGLQSGEALLDALQTDMRAVGPRFTPPTAGPGYADPSIREANGVYYDIWGVGFRMNQTPSGAYMDLAESPLTGLRSAEELESYPWPSPDDWDFSPIPTQLEHVTQYWVWAHSRGIFEISWFIRGFNEFMMDLAMNPDLANALMDKVQGFLMECTKRSLDAGGGRIDMMEYNDDVAGQNGMLISPDMWREFVKPRMAEFIRMCREGYGVKIMYHCCGGLRPIIGDLIEIGVDMLDPVQSAAAGMELTALKRDFGAGITFHGGVDTQELLPYATPDEVRCEVRRIIDVVAKDGGYVLSPSHVFQGDVPVDNILAMYGEGLGKEF